MIYDSQSGDFTLVLTGDSMVSRKLTPFTETNYLAIRDICRGADACFTNLECTVRTEEEGIHDMSVGTMMTTPPHLLDDLKWLGVDLVSTANNHSLDYSFGGLRANTRWLEKAGLVAAGTGENLAEARAPSYLETPGGRVALIAVSSSFAAFNPAGPQRKDMRGRPGLNPLRVQTTYVIPDDRFQQLGLGAHVRPAALRRRHDVRLIVVEEQHLGVDERRRGVAHHVADFEKLRLGEDRELPCQDRITRQCQRQVAQAVAMGLGRR